MAYDFNGTDQWIGAGSAVLTAVPLTIVGWGNTDSDTTNQTFGSITNNSNTNEFSLRFVGVSAGDPVQAATTDTTTSGSANTSTGFSVLTWTHGAAVFSANNSRSAFINGGGKDTNTTSVTPTGLNRTAIGWRDRSGTNAPMDGRLAEIAIWSAALTDDEIVSLTRGFKPYRIRPQSLVFYAPLIRNISDRRGGVALTNNNSATVAAHPRVY